MDRPYELNFNKERRSAWYLKRKKQNDAEYIIVNFAQGKGRTWAVSCSSWKRPTASASAACPTAPTTTGRTYTGRRSKNFPGNSWASLPRCHLTISAKMASHCADELCR
ncbi:hypothetical protein JG688_00018275 [Phytophthora aleatoria]|uniref:Uncharacterized protein n=1 Tax=Phytophthora aleatoria TaxID=2496075 RepID=A0A8J5ICC2_9STRA|nr:hypothetical protein JG688_00018275 [Phytophthora aleatoria]